MIRVSSLSIIFVLGLPACGDNSNHLAPDAPPDAAPAPDAPTDAAPAPDAPTDAALPQPGGGLAVLSTDFASTTVSLIDPATGQVTHATCVDSTTAMPGAGVKLSADVVLPSHAQPDHLLATIDRASSALTWIDPRTCAPARQLDVSSGFAANPQDVVGVSARKAYVTRYARNGSTTDPQGDDVLIVDPSVPAITGRIDLSSYAVPIPGATIQARPGGAILVRGTLYVVLDNLSDDFLTGGHGRVVAIDAATDQVTAAIEIPELDNCTTLAYAAAANQLVVTCNGLFGATQLAGSGLSFIDLAASPPAQVRVIPAAAFGGHPLAAFSELAADRGIGFGVTAGDFASTTDQLWVLDAGAGSATLLDQAADSFVLGAPLLDPSRDVVYVADATPGAPAVRVYRFASGALPAAAASIPAPAALPPRLIAWY